MSKYTERPVSCLIYTDDAYCWSYAVSVTLQAVIVRRNVIMLFKLLNHPLKILNIALIFVAIIFFILLANRKGDYGSYPIIVNWIAFTIFMMNGIYIFNKKRSWAILLIIGATVIGAGTIVSMILYF